MIDRPLTSLPGIGAKTAAWLSDAGISSESELRALGAAAAYCRLKRRNPRAISLNALWALHGALNGVPWNAIPPEEKRRLLDEVRQAPDEPRPPF
jgi:DNA transformation protein